MHLLKERKEYPLLGHTVAGKYVCALVDTARLLCHLACLTVHLQPTKNRDKGFRLMYLPFFLKSFKIFNSQITSYGFQQGFYILIANFN